jgi:tRNA1Val (adenine37-N6)-methyltransferase
MSGSRNKGGFGSGTDRPAPLFIRQPRRGYRFSIDSVLLADFAMPLCGETALDLGTGSGVVLLILAKECPALRRGIGVEIQPELWEFARRNIEENGFAARLAAVLGDFRADLPDLSGMAFDLVVSNPPYRRIGEGRRNPDPRKEIARHEVACTMDDLFGAAGSRLASGGRFAMTGLPARLPEMVGSAAAAGIFPDRLRFVHPFPDRPANLVLFGGSRGKAGGPVVLPPLTVYTERGRYHPEVERIYGRLFGG